MWEGLALWRASSWSNAFGLGFVEGWSQTNDVRRRLQGSRTFKGCASQGVLWSVQEHVVVNVWVYLECSRCVSVAPGVQGEAECLVKA